MANKTVVMGVELASSSVRMVALSHEGNRVIALDAVPVEKNPLEDAVALGVLLEAWVGSLPVKKKQVQTVLSLSAMQSVVRYCEVPAKTPDVREYLEWELGNYLNSPLEEYLWDYELCAATEDDEKIPVTVVATRRSVLKDLVSSLSELGQRPSLVDLDVLAAVNALELADSTALQGETAILKVEKDILQLIRISEGKLVKLQDKVPKENSELSELAEEAKDFLSSITVEKIHLCGELSTESEFREKLSELVEATEFSLLNPFVVCDFAEGLESPDEKRIGSCATALGLALRSKGDRK